MNQLYCLKIIFKTQEMKVNPKLKTMKQILFVLLITATLLPLSSCRKEGCTDITASNFDPEAKKDDGSCVFPEPEPEPDVRDPYLGAYLVTDSLFMFGDFVEVETYSLSVTTGGTIQDTLYLNNLWNKGKNYYVLLTGSTFSIPSQEVNSPYYTSGSGLFTGNIINYETSGDAYINKGEGSK